MFGIRFKKGPPAGSAPGAFTLPTGAIRPRVHVIRYSADSIDEKDVERPGDLETETAPNTVTWIDVQGLGDEAWIRRLRDLFSIPPMAMDDVVHIPQRPKADCYDHHALFVTRMLRLEANGELDVEQISLILGRGYVLTFQERHGDLLDPVRKRLRTDTGTLRRSGPDFLAYAILDTIVDTWFPLLESVGDRLENLEESIMEDPRPGVLRSLNRLRRTILGIRRAIWPTREALNVLMTRETAEISEETRLHLRDTHDHSVHTAEITQSYRETAAELMNTYLSVVGNRMNEVMKVLTIMASIFIPLTFLAGIYGMNFEGMPELKLGWAYPALLGFMAATAGGMILYFRNRGWIGGAE